MRRLCDGCNGKGRLVLYSWSVTRKPVGDVICQRCMGTGRIECPTCNGTGKEGRHSICRDCDEDTEDKP